MGVEQPFGVEPLFLGWLLQIADTSSVSWGDKTEWVTSLSACKLNGSVM